MTRDEIQFIQRWNQAGPSCTADLLTCLFRPLTTAEEVGNHNLILTSFILQRIPQSELPRFLNSVAQLIEDYSMEALSHAQKEKQKS